MPTTPASRNDRGDSVALLSVSIVTFHSNVSDFERLIDSLITELESVFQNEIVDLYLICNDGNLEFAEIVERHLESRNRSKWVSLKSYSDQGNVGYGAGHNLALSRTQARYHLVLNPDVELKKSGLSAALRFMESNPDCVLAAPQGYNNSGRYARLAKRYPSVMVLAARAAGFRSETPFFGHRVDRYTYADRLPSAVPEDIQLASGCCMLCRMSVLRKIGGFDERYFLFFEDYDLSTRLSEHGRIVELPDFRIQHSGGWATRKNPRRMFAFLISMIRFFTSHGWRFS